MALVAPAQPTIYIFLFGWFPSGLETDVTRAMKAEFKKVFKADIRVKRTSWDDDPSHPALDPDKRSVFDADANLLDAFS